jgi:Cu2+-exporting ATPase/Cu+-exporting ATPase
MHVEKALLEVEGITSAQVDLKGKVAIIETDRDVTDAAIKAAVEDAGYDAIKVETAP